MNVMNKLVAVLMFGAIAGGAWAAADTDPLRASMYPQRCLCAATAFTP